MTSFGYLLCRCECNFAVEILDIELEGGCRKSPGFDDNFSLFDYGYF